MQNAKLKMVKGTPAWHAEAARLLTENFGKIHMAFVDATKRAVWMGMFLNHIKDKGKEDGTIPHGQFQPWLEQNAAEIPIRTLRTYMALATGVCEKGQFQIGQFSRFAESGQLPPQLEKMIEGQTQQQLFLEFKNVDADGNPRGKGRLPGCGGTSAEQRALARQSAAEAALRADEIFLKELGAVCDQGIDVRFAMPELEKQFAKTFLQVESLYQFMKRINAGRKAA